MKKLLCLPYAGGSAQIFRNKFEKYLDYTIKLLPIELPGRGVRFGEKMITDFPKLVKELLPQVHDAIDSGDEYSLLGYSMGCKIIYEMYYEIVKMHWKKPELLFFCAAAPPEIPFERKKKDNLSIIAEMKRLGGTSNEVFANQDILDIFLPIMRADMQLLESYQYIGHREKIKIPIVVQYGCFDYDIREYINKWKEYTEDKCHLYEYNGGHFFINNNSIKMAEIINRHLLK